MAEQDYLIQPGDTFYLLAKRWGGTCDDWIQANPQLNPQTLQVGQKVVLPTLKTGRDQYVEVLPSKGREFSGDHMDEIEMEIEGVQFKLRRVGENRVPHEIHVLLPRAEIHKIQPQGEHGPTEVQIMLSNVDIVHSPRLTSGGADKAESGGKGGPSISEDSTVKEVPVRPQGTTQIQGPSRSDGPGMSPGGFGGRLPR